MKISLRNHDLDSVVNLMKKEKVPGFRGKQIYEWVNKGVLSFDEMNNIPKALKEQLEDKFEVSNMKIVEKLVSKSDGTKKYLMELTDGNVIECVFMKYKHGNTLCISTFGILVGPTLK